MLHVFVLGVLVVRVQTSSFPKLSNSIRWLAWLIELYMSNVCLGDRNGLALLINLSLELNFFMHSVQNMIRPCQRGV